MNFLIEYMDWWMGIIGITGQYYTFVKKSWWCPYYGLATQGLWAFYATIIQEYGLLPLVLGSILVFTVAIWKDLKVNYVRVKPENIKNFRKLKSIIRLNYGD
jgi:hypothetical protein